MSDWLPFAHCKDFAFDAAKVARHWATLHAGDAEPPPESDAILNAWALFHSGQFQQAAEAGLKAGGAGITVANKATCFYAAYLEPKEKCRHELFLETNHRAEAQLMQSPDSANAHFWFAYSLGRYGQGISVAKALAQGLGRKIKTALEAAIRLQPLHADAHVALGTFHAEVIDKVGPLIGAMTYGAKKDFGLKMFQAGLNLHPTSAINLVEYANGLVMLEGDAKFDEATQLYLRAAAIEPLDASQHLEVELARAELQS